MSERVQLSRRKGARIPPNTVVVSRPSIFGNPFTVGETSATQAVALFHTWVMDEHALDGYIHAQHADEMRKRRTKLLAALPKLRGKNLACWCALTEPCHADILLLVANLSRDAKGNNTEQEKS